MSSRAKRFCNHHGCNKLVNGGYCDEHKKKDQHHRDKARGSANKRGYTYRWQQYSKWFLKQPDNVFCKLQYSGCNNIAECVDHIDPPDGPNDPKFWDTSNHQGSCIHCNSVKGHRKDKGNAEPFSEVLS